MEGLLSTGPTPSSFVLHCYRGLPLDGLITQYSLKMLLLAISLYVKINSEYLVQNQVQAASQYDLVVQGFSCVLFKVCSINKNKNILINLR